MLTVYTPPRVLTPLLVRAGDQIALRPTGQHLTEYEHLQVGAAPLWWSIISYELLTDGAMRPKVVELFLRHLPDPGPGPGHRKPTLLCLRPDDTVIIRERIEVDPWQIDSADDRHLVAGAPVVSARAA